MQTFHWADYLVLAVVLIGSLLTGVFFACYGGKQRTTGEYFQGNRRLSLVPTAMSIMVSYISGILILGFPAEIFLYGGMLVLSLPGVAVGAGLAAVAFIPLFYPLKLTSINVYLEMRFKSVFPKYMCTLSSILFCIVYSGLVIYAPATTISIVTGIPMWVVILISSVIVIIYTSIGGIKAVIWTDAFQAVCMTLGMAAIATKGIIMAGGMAKTMEYAAERGRLDLLNFDLDPRVRQTFWTMFACQVFWTFLIYGATQSTLQRYCGMETITKARLVMVLVVVFLFAIKIVTFLAGFGMFAYYASIGCDPISAGHISTPNQLVPYFVMETLNYPGIPGLFVSAMCAGGLSSASSVLNAASANTWEDLLKPLLSNRVASDRRDTFIAKGLVVLYGVFAVGAAFLVSTIGGTITQLSVSFNGAILIMAMGSILFSALCPWANWKGVTVGGVSGFIFSMWLCMGSYSIKSHATDMLPLITDSCPARNVSSTWSGESTTAAWSAMNVTATAYSGGEDVMEESSWLQQLYSVNYAWYNLYATIVIFVVGSLVSLATRSKEDKENAEPRLMFETVRLCMRKNTAKDKVHALTNEKDQVDSKEAEAIRTSLI